MTSIPDNSGNGNQLVLHGNSQLTEGLQEKQVNFKSQIRPQGTNAVRAGDRFGEILDVYENIIVAGTPAHNYDINGIGFQNSKIGAAWVFQKTAKPFLRKTQLKQRHKQVFSYTGSNQTFTVPNTVERITIQMIGAGGGGNTLGTFSGGNGGYVKADILVRPGHTYNLVVGQGGVAGGTTRPFGGGGCLSVAGGIGGSGGGRTAIVDPVFGDLLTAGGGGGAGKDGPGGYGGQNAGNGKTVKPTVHPVEVSLDAQGASGYITGYTLAMKSVNYVVLGASYDLKSNILSNTNYYEEKYLGENASPATAISGNVFENGAGGGGFAGGAAGPDGYGYRTTLTGTPTYYSVGGSGSGGSSMADPTIAFAPYVTDENMVTNVVTYDGNALSLNDEFSGFGIGGIGSTPGANGQIILEWDEYVETDDQDIEERWVWNQAAKLTPINAIDRNNNCRFGASVAVLGDWIFVGAPGQTYNNAGLNPLTDAGSVYVYRLEAGVWTFKQRLDPTGTNARNAGDLFGTSLAVIDGKLFVGAPGHAYDASGANSVSAAGAVFAFTLSSDTWTQSDKIVPTGTNARVANGNFGYKIRAQASTLVVSSKNGYNSTGATLTSNAGTVFVFSISGTPTQTARLADAPIANAAFGSAIAIKDNVLVVEASGISGRYIYERDGADWILDTQASDNPVNDYLMYSEMLPRSGNFVGVNGLNFTYKSSTAQIDFYVGSTDHSQVGGGNNNITFSYNPSYQLRIQNTKPFLNLNSFTFEHWVYIVEPFSKLLNDIAGNMLPMVRRKNRWGLYNIRDKGEANGGRCVFRIEVPGEPVYWDFGKLQRRTWTHLAIVRDGDEVRTYNNGVLVNTYNVANITFEDDNSDIVWGFWDEINNVSSANFSVREFAVRNRAVFNRTFTPTAGTYSTYSYATPNTDNTRGRGSSTYIYDTNTILSGLPKSATFEPVKIPDRIANLATTAHIESAYKDSGQIEVINRLNDTWTSLTNPIVAPGHVMRHSGSSGFGTSIYIDKDKLIVSAPYDPWGHSGNYNMGAPGSAYLFDTQNDFEYKTKIVQKSRENMNNANRYFGYYGASNNGNVVLSDYNFVSRSPVYLDFITTTTVGSNYTPYNVKTSYAADTSGRLTELGIVGATLTSMKSILLKTDKVVGAFGVSGLASETVTTGAAFPILNAQTSFAPITNPFAFIDGSLYYVDASGVRVNTDWDDNTNSGFLARMVQDPITYNYTYTQEFSYPGSIYPNRAGGDQFGYNVKVSGNTIFVSEYASDKTLRSNSGAPDRGGIFRYEYVPHKVGWGMVESIFPTETAPINFGYSFDVHEDFLITRSLSTDNSTYVFQNETNGFTFKQKFAEGASSTSVGVDNVRFFEDGRALVGSPNASFGIKTNVGYASFYSVDNGVYSKDTVKYQPKNWVDDRDVNYAMGTSVAMEGDTVIVGAPGYNKVSNETAINPGVGAGFVYKLIDGKWEQKAKLLNEANVAGTGAGSKVDIKNGKFLTVSNQSSLGLANLFAEDAGTYSLTKTFTNANLGTTNFAILNDSHVVLGQPLTGPKTVNQLITTGSFSDFTLDGTTWTKGSNWFTPTHTNGAYDQGVINYTSNANNSLARSADDFFGTAVRLSADKQMLLVGAPGHQYLEDPSAGGPRYRQGAVFTYYWDSATNSWRLNHKLVEPSTGQIETQFGYVLNKATDTSFIVSSKIFNDIGEITRYELSGSGISATWTQTFNFVNNTVAQFGADVVWDEARGIYYVGSPKRTESQVSSGTFEVVTPGSPVTRQSYNNDGSINNRTAADYFGYSVSVNGNSLAIGAPGFDYNNTGTVQNTGKGAAFVYKVTKGGLWTYDQKVTFENNSSSSFGAFVGISDKTLFVQGKDLTPVVFDRDANGKFTINPTVTGNGSFTLDPLYTAQRFAWDPSTKNAITVSTSGTFNVPNTPIAGGGGAFIKYDADTNTYSVQANGIKPATVTATGVVEPMHLLAVQAAGFGQSGMALSPDASMLAIAGASDANNLTTNNPELAYSGAASIGKVFVYRYNPTLTKYEYHSMIKNPYANVVNDKIGLNWVGDRLSVTYPVSGRVLSYKLFDDKFWKVMSNASMESSVASSVLTLDGNALVLAKPTSNGYPTVSQSGAVRVQLLNDGIWGSSRGIHAGADAEAYRGDIGGGGGGAGWVGGKAAGSPNGYYGGLGGTNLVPMTGTAILSNNWARANSASQFATGAGGQTAGANGEDARIVISYNGTDAVFDYTGFDQTFTVPAGITQIDISLWGAGGGAANLNTAFTRGQSGKGGAGANVSATLAVTPGETLTLMVGAGGRGGDLFTSNSNRNQKRKYGLGGLGGVSSLGNVDGGGCGGGLAAIKRGDDFLAIAAGGGGGSAKFRSVAYTLNGTPGGYNVPQDFANTNALIDDGDSVYAPGIINSRVAQDFFGQAVGIFDDNTVLIGAPGHEFDSVGDGLPSGSGAVFEYKRINGKWQLVSKITSGNSVENEGFGSGIEINNDRIVVLGNALIGSLSSDLAGYMPSGNTAIEVMVRDNDKFVSLAKTVITDEDNKTRSAVLDGDHVIAGNPMRDTDGIKPLVNNAGGFTTWNITTPTLTTLGSIAVDSISYSRFDGDLFGSAVEISNNQIFVGAPSHDYTLNGTSYRSGQGALFVFDKKGSGYTYRDKITLETDSTLTGFGKTLKLIGDKLYAGTDVPNKLVELTNNAGSWTISRHIEASTGKVARIVSSNMLMELDPTGSAGVGLQPEITGAGRAKTFTIGVDGTLVDANADYTIPGNSRGRNVGDQFGYSVYANHDFVVVGAPTHQYDVQGNPMNKTGVLYVFNKQGENWVKEVKLVPETTDTVGLGLSLAGRSGWVITGNMDSTNGMARVFQRVAEGNWQPRKTYTGTGLGIDAFGASVAAADTSKYVVGLPKADLVSITGTIADSGMVQTFERQVDTWIDRGLTGAPGLVRGRNEGDWFGYSVAANKNYIVIGSPQYSYDDNGENELNDSGAVWIYLRNKKIPLLGRYVSPSRVANGRFGATVGIDETTNRVAVGEPGANAVHVFAFDGETLTLEQTLTVSLDTDEVFGTTLAFNDGKIVVGSAMARTDANGDNELTEAGAVYVWTRDDSTGVWSVKEKIAGFTDKDGDPLPNSREAGDHFGAAVAIDAKGSLIIGSPDHNWDINGANEVSDAGAVFIKKIK